MVVPDVRWLNPFIRGAFTVLESFGIPAERTGQLAVESTSYTSDAVTVIVPMVGSLEGAVFYGFDDVSAQRLACTMLGQGDHTVWDDSLIESALAEFGNMVCGQASTMLEEQGLLCNIAPPIVATESRLMLSRHAFDRLVVPVTMSLGRLNIRLALREVAPRPAKG